MKVYIPNRPLESLTTKNFCLTFNFDRNHYSLSSYVCITNVLSIESLILNNILKNTNFEVFKTLVYFCLLFSALSSARARARRETSVQTYRGVPKTE